MYEVEIDKGLYCSTYRIKLFFVVDLQEILDDVCFLCIEVDASRGCNVSG